MLVPVPLFVLVVCVAYYSGVRRGTCTYSATESGVMLSQSEVVLEPADECSLSLFRSSRGSTSASKEGSKLSRCSSELEGLDLINWFHLPRLLLMYLSTSLFGFHYNDV